ncbi:hypothetical protein N7510_006496 [Penicillium lagena]|uniref:uncharacterized protein n=1 Tax=Penicillium lagena TaxID=94218 RepID=UPI00253F8276|nr:uncharacterized protein N7510_006496 [Penicillium lagena]KAJ5613302.1 hypothetical protein N7510_006496 [Penicillium lagena]
MAQQPALPPPPGQTSNFAHPKDVLHTVNLVTQVLCIIVVTLFVALRLWIKVCYHQNLNREDCDFYSFLCLHDDTYAPIFPKSVSRANKIVNKYGGGYNIWDVPETEFIKFQKASYATTLIYVPMVFVIKIALLSVMARIFAPDRRKVIVIYTSMVVLLGYYIPALFIKIFFCKPISAYWYGTSNGGSCLDQQKVIIADSAISIAGDVWILILPVQLIWSLHMTTEKKLRVIGILGAGGLATAFSIWRLVIMVEQGHTTNTTWFWIHCVLTANAEAGIGLICACLPVVNNFFTSVKERSRNNTSDGYLNSHELDNYQKRSGSSKNNKSILQDSLFIPSQIDQAHLISTAAGPEPREDSWSSLHSNDNRTDSEGINKDVTVEQSFEVVK